MKHNISTLLILFLIVSNCVSQSISVTELDKYSHDQDMVSLRKIIQEKGFFFISEDNSYGIIYVYGKEAYAGKEAFGFGEINELYSIVYKPVLKFYSSYKEKILNSNYTYTYSGEGNMYYENDKRRIGFNDKQGIISLFTNINDVETHKNNSDQNTIQDKNFITCKVKDMGFISISNNLEIQSGRYKEFSEGYEKTNECYSYEILDNRVIFQQKGVNEFQKTNTYARIIISTTIKENNFYDNLTEEFLITKEELIDLNEIFRSNIEMCGDQKIISWYGTEIVKVNKYYAMKISYLRQLGNNPPVFVEIYKFPNNDRLHELTMSYRLEDAKFWKPLYEKTLESIVIK